MTQPFPTVAELAAEERELQLTSFTNDDAWALGCALVAAARRDAAPVAVEIARNGHRLFSAALPGATPDNASWIERKSRVVHRFGRSSLHVRQDSIERGTTFEAEFGLDPQLYAAHGGAFPLLVRDVGPVGVVAVSGLPQLADHRMVTAVLAEHLGR
ncbi:heme-degrading domain-containing protein [Blastococcus sp. MG754426]|uniref:heme-degrading domain-containing protein n=1 Tax=unclassified Blastococcus TaxID=2619396 RepID=UPI001EEF9B36|nr:MULTISPECIES: heme-degrading domain-containing protein [unclassified Blastococcus]MCF6509579.1 heme-degrading domain-containing protein [Blastococcus sp. MG754426]MCF6514239.1 heme-degrading domain-containing protein [Blastococcus sp. MG754427]MCF6737378.1 heme-degrading domain-containing protein [Blastococcus sp. KM273129]